MYDPFRSTTEIIIIINMITIISCKCNIYIYLFLIIFKYGTFECFITYCITPSSHIILCNRLLYWMFKFHLLNFTFLQISTSGDLGSQNKKDNKIKLSVWIMRLVEEMCTQFKQFYFLLNKTHSYTTLKDGLKPYLERISETSGHLTHI